MKDYDIAKTIDMNGLAYKIQEYFQESEREVNIISRLMIKNRNMKKKQTTNSDFAK